MASDLDHVHLTASDAKAAAEWYAKHLGGTIPEGSSDSVHFGDVVINIREADGDFISNAGTAVDHISFSVPNVQTKMDELEAAGIKVKRWGTHGKKLEALACVLTDPWGTKIEILKDDDLLGFHHVHIKSPYPKDTAEWYSNAFGVDVERYKNLTQIYAMRLNSMYLFVQRAIHPLKPAADSSIYHIGMKVDHFDVSMKTLQAANTTFLKEIHSSGEHMHATVEGPDGAVLAITDIVAD
jgi:catechol 2,3-dioxygenase-like lactoylglutathione lyase family enzyme